MSVTGIEKPLRAGMTGRQAMTSLKPKVLSILGQIVTVSGSLDILTKIFTYLIDFIFILRSSKV